MRRIAGLTVRGGGVEQPQAESPCLAKSLTAQHRNAVRTLFSELLRAVLCEIYGQLRSSFELSWSQLISMVSRADVTDSRRHSGGVEEEKTAFVL